MIWFEIADKSQPDPDTTTKHSGSGCDLWTTSNQITARKCQLSLIQIILGIDIAIAYSRIFSTTHINNPWRFTDHKHSFYFDIYPPTIDWLYLFMLAYFQIFVLNSMEIYYSRTVDWTASTCWASLARNIGAISHWHTELSPGTCFANMCWFKLSSSTYLVCRRHESAHVSEWARLGKQTLAIQSSVYLWFVFQLFFAISHSTWPIEFYLFIHFLHIFHFFQGCYRSSDWCFASCDHRKRRFARSPNGNSRTIIGDFSTFLRYQIHSKSVIDSEYY